MFFKPTGHDRKEDLALGSLTNNVWFLAGNNLLFLYITLSICLAVGSAFRSVAHKGWSTIVREPVQKRNSCPNLSGNGEMCSPKRLWLKNEDATQ